MDQWQALAEGVNEDRLLNTLMEMVAIPSPSGEEGKIGRFIAEKSRAWGLDVQVKPVIDDRVNVHIALSGEEPGPTFLFNGHLDTEPLAPGWTLSPLGIPRTTVRFVTRNGLPAGSRGSPRQSVVTRPDSCQPCF